MDNIMLMIIEPDACFKKNKFHGVHTVEKAEENTAHSTYFSYLLQKLPEHLKKIVCLEESYTTAIQFALKGNIYFSGYDVSERNKHAELFISPSLTSLQLQILQILEPSMLDFEFIIVDVSKDPSTDVDFVLGKNLIEFLMSKFMKQECSESNEVQKKL